ncbi:(2Fe-2S)-binding protein [Limnoglobus roseus]|uniref:(2Fe-2S)-binding protein n=1 Tax=Limnoglobus roseus TaxID=2598579 RepID=A0A5C1A9Y4_9BACT|nr:(2Fe-2S)-binding protein [Limnoglobus roseus]QEL16189.1 (2Fe-2S)-binding protein [Limnoglobus roseus]
MTSLEAVVAVESEAACAGECQSCPSVGSCGDRLACRCLRVTEHEVVTAIRTIGLTTICELKAATGAGDGCTCCHKQLQQYLTVYSPSSSPSNKCWAK